jgi:hypothetical protein
MYSFDQSKDAHAVFTPQPQPGINAASSTGEPSWYSMLSQSGTPAPVSALSDAHAGSTGYTALPYPPAGQSPMPTPGYYAPTQTVSSYGQDSSALQTKEPGFAVSASERVPDESINLLADTKAPAIDQSAGAQAGVSGDASREAGADDKTKQPAAPGKFLSMCGQVRAITVGVIMVAIGSAYIVFDVPEVELAYKPKKGGNMSAAGYLMIFAAYSGIMTFSVLRKSKMRPSILFYWSILSAILSIVVFFIGLNGL